MHRSKYGSAGDGVQTLRNMGLIWARLPVHTITMPWPEAKRHHMQMTTVCTLPAVKNDGPDIDQAPNNINIYKIVILFIFQ